MGRTAASTSVQATAADGELGLRERLGPVARTPSHGSGGENGSINGEEAVTLVITPKVLREALRAANRHLDGDGESDGAETEAGRTEDSAAFAPSSLGDPSVEEEEDYDDMVRREAGTNLVVRRRHKGGTGRPVVHAAEPVTPPPDDDEDYDQLAAEMDDLQPLSPMSSARRGSVRPMPTRLVGTDGDGRGKTYLLQADDVELKEILRGGLKFVCMSRLLLRCLDSPQLTPARRQRNRSRRRGAASSRTSSSRGSSRPLTARTTPRPTVRSAASTRSSGWPWPSSCAR